MKRVYYGTCNTESNISNKEVIVSDSDVVDIEDFNFDEGDLLVVLFAHENTVDEPTLVIYVNDTEVQPSTSEDEGKYVKTHDVEADCAGAWGDGETVIFAYTQLSTSQTYYWELINAVHASTDIYGVTKLFDDSDFNTWIKTTEEPEDSEMALAPNTLKKLYQLLIGDEDEGTGLIWTPASDSAEQQTLGQLSLTSGGSSVYITYPLDSVIQQYVSNKTHTGQLINNGNGSGPDGTGNSEPFITRYISDDLYFNNGGALRYQPSGSGAVPVNRIILNDSNNKITIGLLNDDTLAGIVLSKPTQIVGNARIDGGLTTSESITVEGSNRVSAHEFEEGGKLLKTKYSTILKTKTFSDLTGSISSGQSCPHKYITVTEEGWEPLGIIGYNVDFNAGLATDAMYANVWECHLYNSNQVQYAIYNLKDKAINVKITITILYRQAL